MNAYSLLNQPNIQKIWHIHLQDMPYPYIVLITFQKLYLAFLAAFPLLLCVAFLIVYQSVPVIHTDEYAPQTIPARSGIANQVLQA